MPTVTTSRLRSVYPLSLPFFGLLGAACAHAWMRFDPVFWRGPMSDDAIAWLAGITIQGALLGVIAPFAIEGILETRTRLIRRGELDDSTFFLPIVAGLVLWGCTCFYGTADSSTRGSSCRLLDQHDLRMRGFIYVAAFVAWLLVTSMWLETLPRWSKDRGVVDLLMRRDRVRSAMTWLGLEVSLTVLTTDRYSRASRDAWERLHHQCHFSDGTQLTLLYGAGFSVFVALAYLPCARRLRELALELREAFLPDPGDDVVGWSERWTKLDAVLPVDHSFVEVMRSSIPILAPLVSALATFGVSR